MVSTMRLSASKTFVLSCFYISLVHGSYGPPSPPDCTTKTVTSHETVPAYKPYTSTWCPDCETVTTTYETVYSEFCPTGVTPHTYTITETCGGKVGSPCRTGVPSGFTTTSTVCEACGPTPITTTLTVPCTNTPATITYETVYSTFCPTGLVPATYTVTHTCDSGPCSPPTGIPPGYTPKVSVCSDCGPTPITATLIYPTPKPSAPATPYPPAPKPETASPPAPKPETASPPAPKPETPKPVPTNGSGGSYGGSGQTSGAGSKPTPSAYKTNEVGPIKSNSPSSPNEPEEYTGQASRNLGYGSQILTLLLPGLAALFW